MADVTGCCRPKPGSLTGIVLNVPTMGEIDFYFPMEDDAKRFTEEAYLLPRTHISCLLSCITKIYIPIELRELPWRKSPGYISLAFWASRECISPTLTSDIYSLYELEHGVDGFVVGEEGGRFVSIFDELVGEEKIASSSAACALFTDIGHITGNVEDHVSVMIVDCGIGVVCCIVL